MSQPCANIRSWSAEGTNILHADLDSFYASVEQRDAPHLRGRPVIVGGGVVLAASYEAKAYGVRSAMGGAQARRLCPWAIVVPPRMSAYSEASKAVFEVFDDTTPLVEGISIDEAFLDVGGLRRVSGTPLEIAVRLRAEVRRRVDLPITVGVARTKFLAKVASGVGKPDGLLVVPADRELAVPPPPPGRAAVGRGADHGRQAPHPGHPHRGRGGRRCPKAPWCRCSAWHRAATSTPWPTTATPGRWWSAGVDARWARSTPSAGVRSQPADIDASLVALVDRVTRRMRAAHRVGRTVVLRLRFDDFSRATRSHTIARATADTRAILAAARDLLATATPLIERQGITLVGVAVTNLDNDDAVQLPLPFDGIDAAALDIALDDVRERFGTKAVSRAVLLGRPEGMTMPMLPD